MRWISSAESLLAMHSIFFHNNNINWNFLYYIILTRYCQAFQKGFSLLVVGGSLGTRTLNEMMKRWVEQLDGKPSPIQVIWQTGKFYEKEMRSFFEQHKVENIWQGAFIDRMDYAYEVADAVISRSGACTVSELCLVGKPTIFVPSPNVAEDHQTKNAMALVERDAALMVRDAEAVAKAMAVAQELLSDKERLATLSRNISSLGIADAAERVVRQIEKEW